MCGQLSRRGDFSGCIRDFDLAKFGYLLSGDRASAQDVDLAIPYGDNR